MLYRISDGSAQPVWEAVSADGALVREIVAISGNEAINFDVGDGYFRKVRLEFADGHTEPVLLAIAPPPRPV